MGYGAHKRVPGADHFRHRGCRRTDRVETTLLGGHPRQFVGHLGQTGGQVGDVLVELGQEPPAPLLTSGGPMKSGPAWRTARSGAEHESPVRADQDSSSASEIDIRTPRTVPASSRCRRERRYQDVRQRRSWLRGPARSQASSSRDPARPRRRAGRPLRWPPPTRRDRPGHGLDEVATCIKRGTGPGERSPGVWANGQEQGWGRRPPLALRTSPHAGGQGLGQVRGPRLAGGQIVAPWAQRLCHEVCQRRRPGVAHGGRYFYGRTELGDLAVERPLTERIGQLRSRPVQSFRRLLAAVIACCASWLASAAAVRVASARAAACSAWARRP